MNTRQKLMLERLDMLEKKLTVLQETIEALPETKLRHQVVERSNSFSRSNGSGALRV